MGYSPIESLLPGKEIFIVGENHTFLESNTKLWIQNIRYLHKHAGVRNILMEHGQSNAWLVNTYIQTGDEEIYKVIKKYAFEEYAWVYKELMKFNSSLKDDEKLQVIGLDLERGSYGAVKVLSMLIPTNRQPHDSIDLHIESIKGMAAYQDQEIFKGETGDEETNKYFGYTYSATNTLKLVVDNFSRNERHYKALLQDSFEVFKGIINGVKHAQYWNGLETEKTVQDYVYREEYMYRRFLEEYGQHEGNYYGQFGRCHATKKRADKNSCEWYVFKSLGNRLKESAQADFKSRILTIGMLYETDNDYESEGWEAVDGKIESVFEQLDANRVLLYDLQKDTILGNFFAEDFDLLFFNTNRPDEEHPYYNGSYEWSDDWEQRIKIGYTRAIYEIDLNSLGLIHNEVNRLKFDEPLTLNGLFLTTSNGDEDIKSIVSTTYLGFVAPIESTESDSLGSVVSRLGGAVYNSMVMFDVMPDSKVLDFMIGGALGYSQLWLKVTEENVDQHVPISSGFVGERRTTIYRNPALTGTLAAGVDLNISRLTIGAEVGAVYDMSKKNWRLDGELLETGPATSFRGIYANLRVGVNFGT